MVSTHGHLGPRSCLSRTLLLSICNCFLIFTLGLFANATNGWMSLATFFFLQCYDELYLIGGKTQ